MGMQPAAIHVFVQETHMGVQPLFEFSSYVAINDFICSPCDLHQVRDTYFHKLLHENMIWKVLSSSCRVPNRAVFLSISRR